MLSVVSHLVALQVWKYCDDCKTVLSHPSYDVPRPGTGEDLVRQHADLTECLRKLYFYGVERDDMYVFRVMQPPAVRHACPDVDSGKHPRRQQSSGVRYLCWPRAWSHHGENGGYVSPVNCWRVYFLLSFFFPQLFVLSPTLPSPSRLRLSDPDVPRRWACPGGYGELWLPCTFSWYAAWVSHLPCQCSAGGHSGHHCQRSQHW